LVVGFVLLVVVPVGPCRGQPFLGFVLVELGVGDLGSGIVGVGTPSGLHLKQKYPWVFEQIDFANWFLQKSNQRRRVLAAFGLGTFFVGFVVVVDGTFEK